MHAKKAKISSKKPWTESIEDSRPPRTVGYARVSTEDQRLDMQMRALKDAGCELIYTDHGQSGAKTKRPGLDELIANLRPGDTIIVWKLDRLGRSLRHLADLAATFEAHDIQLRSISEAIDTTTPGGRFFFHIICALAQFERDLISERTREGLREARKRGVKLGRPRL